MEGFTNQMVADNIEVDVCDEARFKYDESTLGIVIRPGKHFISFLKNYIQAKPHQIESLEDVKCSIYASSRFFHSW